MDDQSCGLTRQLLAIRVAPFHSRVERSEAGKSVGCSFGQGFASMTPTTKDDAALPQGPAPFYFRRKSSGENMRITIPTALAAALLVGAPVVAQTVPSYDQLALDEAASNSKP